MGEVEFGNLIYSMPIDRLKKMRTQLKLLVVIWIIILIFLSEISFHVIFREKNLLSGGIILLIIFCFIFLIFVLTTPLTVHNQLKIFENAIIPLRRPFFKPKDETLHINDIIKIEFDGMKDAETEIYQFDIFDKKLRHFRINSLVLARYDKNERSLKKIHKALMELKGRVENN